MYSVYIFRKEGDAVIYDLQKASMLKRVSAFLLDAILLVILATFAAWILSVCTGYDKSLGVYTEAYSRYAAESGLTDEMILKDPGDLTAEEKSCMDAFTNALYDDPEAMHAYNMIANLSVLIVSFALMAAFLVLEFVVPLILRNGQTVGKKIFGLGLMHTEGVRIQPVALFIRTILGKYAVETMPLVMAIMAVTVGLGSPVFLLVSALLIVVQLLLLILSRENALLHDKMAVTVAVDLSSQMIFNTRDEMLEYKKKVHAEKAASSTY